MFIITEIYKHCIVMASAQLKLSQPQRRNLITSNVEHPYALKLNVAMSLVQMNDAVMKFKKKQQDWELDLLTNEMNSILAKKKQHVPFERRTTPRPIPPTGLNRPDESLIELRPSSIAPGRQFIGVYAKKPVPIGQCVAPYAGFVMTVEEFNNTQHHYSTGFQIDTTSAMTLLEGVEYGKKFDRMVIVGYPNTMASNVMCTTNTQLTNVNCLLDVNTDDGVATIKRNVDHESLFVVSIPPARSHLQRQAGMGAQERLDERPRSTDTIQLHDDKVHVLCIGSTPKGKQLVVRPYDKKNEFFILPYRYCSHCLERMHIGEPKEVLYSDVIKCTECTNEYHFKCLDVKDDGTKYNQSDRPQFQCQVCVSSKIYNAKYKDTDVSDVYINDDEKDSSGMKRLGLSQSDRTVTIEENALRMRPSISRTSSDDVDVDVDVDTDIDVAKLVHVPETRRQISDNSRKMMQRALVRRIVIMVGKQKKHAKLKASQNHSFGVVSVPCYVWNRICETKQYSSDVCQQIENELEHQFVCVQTNVSSIDIVFTLYALRDDDELDKLKEQFDMDSCDWMSLMPYTSYEQHKLATSMMISAQAYATKLSNTAKSQRDVWLQLKRDELLGHDAFDEESVNDIRLSKQDLTIDEEIAIALDGTSASSSASTSTSADELLVCVHLVQLMNQRRSNTGVRCSMFDSVVDGDIYFQFTLSAETREYLILQDSPDKSLCQPFSTATTVSESLHSLAAQQKDRSSKNKTPPIRIKRGKSQGKSTAQIKQVQEREIAAQNMRRARSDESATSSSIITIIGARDVGFIEFDDNDLVAPESTPIRIQISSPIQMEIR